MNSDRIDAPHRYRNGPRWTSRFRHVCGIAHTNYEAYAIADNEDKDGAPEEYFNVRASVKLQFVLQFWVCRGSREVFLSQYGRVYPSEVVSEFEPKT